MKKDFDLSNEPDDVFINADGKAVEGAGGIIAGIKGVMRLTRGKKAQKAHEAETARALAAMSQEAGVVASQAKASQARLVSMRAESVARGKKRDARRAARRKRREEDKKAGKIMGMKKPVFFSIVGVTVLTLIIGGVVIYKKTRN